MDGRDFQVSSSTYSFVADTCQLSPPRGATYSPSCIAATSFTPNGNRHSVYPAWWSPSPGMAVALASLVQLQPAAVRRTCFLFFLMICSSLLPFHYIIYCFSMTCWVVLCSVLYCLEEVHWPSELWIRRGLLLHFLKVHRSLVRPFQVILTYHWHLFRLVCRRFLLPLSHEFLSLRMAISLSRFDPFELHEPSWSPRCSYLELQSSESAHVPELHGTDSAGILLSVSK